MRKNWKWKFSIKYTLNLKRLKNVLNDNLPELKLILLDISYIIILIFYYRIVYNILFCIIKWNCLKTFLPF